MKTRVVVAAIVALAMSASSAFAQVLLTGTASNSVSGGGPLAGAQVGYNWQLGSFVTGIESDLSGGPQSAMNTTLPIAATTTAVTNTNVNWFGTVRGRLGWAVGPVLFYGTGGLAYGNVDITTQMNISGVLSLASETSPVRAGWVAGGGIDYMVLPNMILNFGYQHVDLGSASFGSSTTVLTSTLSQSATARAQFNVFTVGVSWLFSFDKSPHGAWEGMYAGGHVGGAWGDVTNASYFVQTPPFVSDVRLKRDIVLVRRLDDGLGLYRYRYLWSDTVFVGVMAQEVALIRPDAIVRDGLDDYLRVDYGRLGLKLMTWPEWQAAEEAGRL